VLFILERPAAPPHNPMGGISVTPNGISRYPEEVRMRSRNTFHGGCRSLALVLALGTAALAAVGCDDAATRYNKAGLEAYQVGDYPKARAAFAEASTENPTKGEYYFNRGTAEQALGQFDKAIASYELAINLSPRIWRAFANQAICYIEKGDEAKAQEVLISGTNANPFTGEAFINIGRFFIDRKDLPSARQWLAKGTAADPENPKVHREYGFLLARMGEKDKAASELKKSLDLQPIQPDVSAMLSELAPSGDQLPPPKPMTK
jgi:tetratricopeptide (TPR) repeat protein